jgi:hypothetical protein
MNTSSDLHKADIQILETFDNQKKWRPQIEWPPPFVILFPKDLSKWLYAFGLLILKLNVRQPIWKDNLGSISCKLDVHS